MALPFWCWLIEVVLEKEAVKRVFVAQVAEALLANVQL